MSGTGGRVRARVHVTLKKSVFDPQGRTILEALRSLGHDEVTDVRQGKFFELSLEGLDAAAARDRVQAIAEKVLSNPVIEACHVEIEE